jgi:hypothetical protein
VKVWCAKSAVNENSVISIVVIALFFTMFWENRVFAVGGISNSKIVVPSAETVPKKHVEFEPFFSFEFVEDRNNTFRLGAGTRITLGILDNLEAGVNINYLNHENSDLTDQVNDFGDIEAGVKYRFIDQGGQLPFSLAYQGGVSIPTSGNDTPWFIEPGGLILTKNFSENFSLDADFVFGIVEDNGWNFVSDIGFGYFLLPWFQAVIEGAYAYEDINGERSTQVVNITPGFTSPVTDWLTIIIGVTPDIYAENTEKEVVISAAFTFLF